MAAAVAAADAASDAMAKGDAAGSGQGAAATASLLRAAQAKLDPKGGDQNPDQKQQAKKPSLADLLHALITLQSALVSDCTGLDARIGEQEPDFAAKRDLQGFAQTQSDILLRLHQEGEVPLQDPQHPDPIGLAALHRVAAAMNAAEDRLAKPALGSQGMRLERIALAELTRLSAIVDGRGQPPHRQGQGGGGGNQSGNQAPFPPAAEIAWLLANQDEVSAETAAGRPIDLGAAEGEVRDLVAGLLGAARPSSRPAVLLERVQRAAASAAWRLARQDRGATTRDEQDACSAALRRILAEIEDQQGGKGGGGSDGSPTAKRNQQNSQQQRRPSDSPKPDGSPDPSQNAPTSGNRSQVATSNGGGGGHGDQVETNQEGDPGPNLPPEQREHLREAYAEHLAPRTLQLYRRYLEELDAKP
jgi:hypothetical protein